MYLRQDVNLGVLSVAEHARLGTASGALRGRFRQRTVAGIARLTGTGFTAEESSGTARLWGEEHSRNAYLLP